MQLETKKHNPTDFSRSPRLQKYLAEPDQLDKIAEFRKWLSVYLVGHGQYKITQKGYAELAPGSDMGRKKTMAVVAKKVDAFIAEGKTAELFEKEHITRKTQADWSDASLRKETLTKFIEGFKDPKKIQWGDFCVAGLGALIKTHYEQSPYQVFVDVGIAYSQPECLEHAERGDFKIELFYPWEIGTIPKNFFENAEYRIAAIKWVVWKAKKPLKDLYFSDIQDELPGLSQNTYKGSLYLPLAEAGFAYTTQEIIAHSNAGKFEDAKAYPWELTNTPNRFFQNKVHRVAAVRWTAWTLGKPVEHVSYTDFENNGLSGLIHTYPHSELIEEALEAA